MPISTAWAARRRHAAGGAPRRRRATSPHCGRFRTGCASARSRSPSNGPSGTGSPRSSCAWSRRRTPAANLARHAGADRRAPACLNARGRARWPSSTVSHRPRRRCTVFPSRTSTSTSSAAVDTLVDVCGAAVLLENLGVDASCARRCRTPRPRARRRTASCRCRRRRRWSCCAAPRSSSADGGRELVTPTGAALASTLAESFGGLPPLLLESIGYGAGSDDFPDRPNVVRVLLGSGRAGGRVGGRAARDEPRRPQPRARAGCRRAVFCGRRPRRLDGARVDEEGTPGIVLSALARPADERAVAAAMLEETSALGVRVSRLRRYELEREGRVVELDGGAVRVKLGRLNGRVVNVAPEHDDCAELARRTGRPVKAVWAEALASRFPELPRPRDDRAYNRPMQACEASRIEELEIASAASVAPSSPSRAASTLPWSPRWPRVRSASARLPSPPSRRRWRRASSTAPGRRPRNRYPRTRRSRPTELARAGYRAQRSRPLLPLQDRAVLAAVDASPPAGGTTRSYRAPTPTIWATGGPASGPRRSTASSIRCSRPGWARWRCVSSPERSGSRARRSPPLRALPHACPTGRRSSPRRSPGSTAPSKA